MTQVTHDHLERFYSLLARLSAVPGQGRPLCKFSECRPSLPERGVYFFQEPGEYRAEKPNILRIVRVGTHAVSAGAKSTLYSRLKAHLGTQTGSGNHRGSVFRRHIGDALARDEKSVTTWGVGSSAPLAVRNCATARADEAVLEKRVSEYIGAMPVLWVCIPDEPNRYSERAFIEKNAIALLSNQLAPLDKASEKWLGRIVRSIKFVTARFGT